MIERHWRELGRPAPFTAVEMGGGRGTLARDLVESARADGGELGAALRYVLIELSPRLLRAQRERTAGLGVDGVLSTAFDLPLAGVTGCFVSVELPDAFPFHRLVHSGGRLLEIDVGIEDGELFETALAPTHAAPEAAVGALGVEVPDGVEFSVSLLARRWIAEVARALARGLVITIDYGYADRALIAERGVPARYFGQRDRVGAFDITTDVDFTALIEVGESAALQTVALADEVEFTAGWGRFPFGVPGRDGRARYALVQRRG